MSKKELVLGIDLGTGSTKCVVVDENGSIVGSSSRGYTTSYPVPGAAEQNPDDWYVAVVSAVREVIYQGSIDPDAIVAIGVCGAAHVPVLLDGSFNVLRPGILWTDQRSTLEVQELINEYGDEILETSFNQASSTWTLPQLIWIMRNETEVFSRIQHMLIAKDYLIYKLTGVLTADIGSATSTLMVDARKNEWSSWLCDLSGLRKSAFPPIIDSGSIVGTLTKECSRELGLNFDVRVISGGLDSAMELLGNGVIQQDQTYVRLGSAGAVMKIVQYPSPHPDVLTYPYVLDSRWYQQAGTNSCSTAIQWVRDIVGAAPSETEKGLSYADLDRLASPISPGSDGLLFNPYLIGERSPYWDPNLRASFIGLSITHQKGHFVRAVLEGVGYSLRDCLESLKHIGSPVKKLSLGGGGSKSELWSQIICDILGLPVIKTDVDDSAFGAAMFAALKVGIFSDIENAVDTWVVEKDPIMPNQKHSLTYSEMFSIYKDVHDNLAPIYLRGSTSQLNN